MLERLGKGGLTMLADEEKFPVAIGIGPEPSFGAVVTSAIFSATGQIPEGDADVFTGQPFPIGAIGAIAHETQPILTAWIVAAVRDDNKKRQIVLHNSIEKKKKHKPMPAPQFPTDESL